MKHLEERYKEAEIAKFTPQEVREYEASKKAERKLIPKQLSVCWLWDFLPNK